MIQRFCSAVRVGTPLSCGRRQGVRFRAGLHPRQRSHQAEGAADDMTPNALKLASSLARRGQGRPPDQAAVRLHDAARVDHPLRARSGHAPRHRRPGAAVQGQHHPGARGAPPPAVGRAGPERRARRRDRGADLARLGGRGVHAARRPRGRRRARGGRTGDARPISRRSPGSSPKWIARSKPARRCTGPRSTRASISRSAVWPTCPSCTT